MFNKITVLSAAAPMLFTATQATAASISFYLDQSNELLDGVNYAQVTISDSTTIAGDIDFQVELLTDAFTVSGSNFGMQDFLFNVDDSLSVETDNIIDISQSGWTVKQNANAGGSFGKFDFQLAGNGSSRTDLLTFSISGVSGDSIYSYAMGSSLNPAAEEYFSTHIAGFDMVNGVTSAKFAGSTSVVPVPASVWLFVSGLLGLMAVTRSKLN